MNVKNETRRHTSATWLARILGPLTSRKVGICQSRKQLRIRAKMAGKPDQQPQFLRCKSFDD